jgi:hypothetical protein
MIRFCASAGKHRKNREQPARSDVFHKAGAKLNGYSETRESAEESRREKAGRQKGDGEKVGGEEAGREKGDGEKVSGQEAGREEDDGEKVGREKAGREKIVSEEVGCEEAGREKVEGEKAGGEKVCRQKVDGSQDDRSASGRETPFRRQVQRASRAGTQGESPADNEAEGAQARLIFPAASQGAEGVAYLPRSPCADGVLLFANVGMKVAPRLRCGA